MFNSNPLRKSVQAGYIGNAGAPDTTVAGTWTRDPFPQGQQPEADQLWRRGMQDTEKGRQMQENIQKLRQTLPQAMDVPGMNIGNVATMSGPLTLNPYSSYAQSLIGNNKNQEFEGRPESLFSGPNRLNPYNSYAQSLIGNNENQEFEGRPEPLFSGPNRFNPLSRYMQSIGIAKEAGFDRKTVS
jgi:hypothetical protein